ncbi:hypothetical protein AA313_de0200543 [Arthrobotrys entomopaga]|nr:hypothetical protein AA313_de0200543 [Arthrobotrys entomopaga]
MNRYSRLFETLNRNNDNRFCLVGLPGAGKSTLLYQLRLGEIETTTPSEGFNVQTIAKDTTVITSWNVGSDYDKFHPLWKHWFPNTKGLVFVVDSSNADSLNDAAVEFQALLNESLLSSTSFLVLANKMDLPDAKSIDEISQIFGLIGVRGRRWHVAATNAVSGDGLYDALEWLVDSVRSRH